jgi:hypothetical protein
MVAAAVVSETAVTICEVQGAVRQNKLLSGTEAEV